jgi:cytochrome P450
VIFTLYLIASHWHVADKLFEELLEVMPTKDCAVDESSLDNLKYLKACIQESYRLLPTAPRLARLVETSVTIRDYKIPANVRK